MGMADVQTSSPMNSDTWMRLLDIYSPNTCGDVTMWGTAALGETKKRTLGRARHSAASRAYMAAARRHDTDRARVAVPCERRDRCRDCPDARVDSGVRRDILDVYLGTTASPAFGATVIGTWFESAHSQQERTTGAS